MVNANGSQLQFTTFKASCQDGRRLNLFSKLIFLCYTYSKIRNDLENQKKRNYEKI